MQKIIPKETRKTQRKDIYIPDDLQTCEFVFIKIDKVKTGLTDPYDGPF